MKIQVTLKQVYGVERFYPHCDKAKIFCKLVKQGTLTRQDLQHIKQLGVEVEVVQPEVKL
jgi:hypothetical protein